MSNVESKKWQFVRCESAVGMGRMCEDDSIFTEDGEEVLGCSEWLRCEVLQYIVDLHNKRLESEDL